MSIYQEEVLASERPYVDLEKLLKDKTSVIRIPNTDEMCLARALVVAVARIVKDPQWNNIRQGRAIQKNNGNQSTSQSWCTFRKVRNR